MIFLTEHGIGSYGELAERCDAIATYRKLKPIYNRYKTSKNKKKFLRGL